MRSSVLVSVLEPLRFIIRDPLAIVGIIVLSAIIAMALFAPVIATHDPRVINEREEASLLIRPPGAAGQSQWRLAPALGPLTVNAAAGDGQRIVAVGRQGSVHEFDGSRWQTLDSPFTHDLHDITWAADGRWLVVGAAGTLGVYDGSDWQLIATLQPVDLRAAAWIDAERALLVGANETLWVLNLTDHTLTPLTSPIGRGLELRSVALDHEGQLLAVGERGLTLQIDPDTATVSLLRLPSTRDLNHIMITPGGAALAVGERGTLLRRAGPEQRWVSETAPDSRAMRAGWISDDGRAVAVGRNAIIAEFDGDQWQLAPTEGERHLRALAVSGDTLMALGSDRFVSRLLPPSDEHWFGTDHLGRDLFSQNVYGSQIALLVGFIGATLVVLIGANVGLIAGYFRGRTETVLMRTVDVMYGIPFEPFALILVLLFDPSLTIVILAVSLLTWRTVARLIRSQVLSLRERPFVKAARVAGASDLRIMYLHIFPNVMPLVFLELAIIVGVAIIAEATLSFLGLGPPQSISWGGILHNARLSGAWRTAWWWNIPPGVFIMLTVMSVFFISRSLELVANPRLRTR